MTIFFRLCLTFALFTAACGGPQKTITNEDVCEPACSTLECNVCEEGECISRCKEWQYCQGGVCIDASNTDCISCEGKTLQCFDENTVETCINGCWEKQDCPEGLLCEQGLCKDRICEAEQVIDCSDYKTKRVCNEYGTGHIEQACESNEFCIDGTCEVKNCYPNRTRCLDSKTFQRCSSDGETWNTEEVCLVDEVCGSTGCETFCEADSYSCSDDRRHVLQCSSDGSSWMISETCQDAQLCQGMFCLDLCEVNSKVATYLGCEYWAVDLRNSDGFDADDAPLTVVVSNPNDTFSAKVNIYTPDGNEVYVGPDTTVPPLGQKAFVIHSSMSVAGSGITEKSYHIRSSVPVTAHQFNPANNTDVFSNDASLLLPKNALGKEYLVLGYPTWSTTRDTDVTIVATEFGTTEITVTTPVTATIDHGIDFTMLVDGSTRTFQLEQHQVLNLETKEVNTSYEKRDVTGMEIIADKKIAVFFGHECANVPDNDTGYCDHMEQQMYSVDTWGKEYIASKTYPRGTETDVWRIMASQDGTLIQTYPAQDNVNMITRDRGDFVTFASDQSFEVHASKPVLVGQFMVGSDAPEVDDYPGCRDNNDEKDVGIGDPTYILGVPTAQFRKDYLVYTPFNYVEDYINVVAMVDSSIVIDGQSLSTDGASVYLDGTSMDRSRYQPIGYNVYGLYQLAMSDGTHHITGSEPFGLSAYGYDCHVSYGYPGGLDLDSLTDSVK